MKYLVFSFFIIIFMGCTHPPNGLSPNATYKQILIYDAIQRSLHDKTMPAYPDLKGLKTVYVNRICYIKFIGGSKEDLNPILNEADIPARISDIKFELKSEKEIQAMANEKGFDIFFLVFGHLEIKGDIATIGIDGWHREPEPWSGRYWCGTGSSCILQYKRINGHWAFDKRI
ncbi:MAG: hypothetical protein ACT4ON_11450 [Bacteroidota bacterium]